MPTFPPDLARLLDVAIVLVAVYATLSCACSWIQERIAAFLALRGWGLFRGIAHLSSDAVAARIFNNPMVANTSPRPDRKVKASAPKQPSTLARFADVAFSRPPAYLDARNFSTAFWQELVTAHVPNLPVAVASKMPAGVTVSASSPEALAQLVVNAPKDAIATLTDAVNTATGIPPAIKSQALGLLAAAGTDYAKLLAATDGWFNAQMDRVSGWYKRETQWVLIAIAALVVTFTGVDTIEVTRTLYLSDPCTLAKFEQSAEGLTSSSAPQALPPECAPAAPKPSVAPRTPVTPAPAAVSTTAPVTAQFDVTKFAHPAWAFAANWGYHDAAQSYYRWPGMLLTLLGARPRRTVLVRRAQESGQRPQRRPQARAIGPAAAVGVALAPLFVIQS